MRHYTLATLLALAIALSGCGPATKVRKQARKSPETLIKGFVAPGFEPVKQAFTENFSERGEWGAACAVYHKGQLVVNLWAGYSQKKQGILWDQHTMAPLLGASKGVAALTTAHAKANDRFDYFRRVAFFWPGFANYNKRNITVAQLLNHEAGLPVPDLPITLQLLNQPDSLKYILETQIPKWPAGHRHGYHHGTMGLYMSQLIALTDTGNRDLKTYFEQEMAQPHQLECAIGLPQNLNNSLRAISYTPPNWKAVFNLGKFPKEMRQQFNEPLFKQTFNVPANYSPNDTAWQHANLPGQNVFCTATALAKLYGLATLGNKGIGLDSTTLSQLSKPAQLPAFGAKDAVLGFNTYYSYGFGKPGPDTTFGTAPSAFGAYGNGATLGYANPQTQTGFAYISAKGSFYPYNDPRTVAVNKALVECLNKLRPK